MQIFSRSLAQVYNHEKSNNKKEGDKAYDNNNINNNNNNNGDVDVWVQNKNFTGYYMFKISRNEKGIYDVIFSYKDKSQNVTHLIKNNSIMFYILFNRIAKKQVATQFGWI